MVKTRIPKLLGTSKKSAFAWLTELHKKGLLFCLDDNPHDIVSIADGTPTFTDREATEITEILVLLFAKLGNQLHDLAFEVVSRTFHTRTERRAFNTMYG